MTTEHFAEFADHTAEEAEMLLKWAGVNFLGWRGEGWKSDYEANWLYSDALDLQMWLHEQTILAVRAGGGEENGS